MVDRVIRVEVVHLGTQRQWLWRIEVGEGSTVMQAISASGAIEALPPGTVDPDRLGIFSRRVSPDRKIQAGDRIEIYRPLTLDPMEARRRRAR